jgi:hypothetical protein
MYFMVFSFEACHSDRREEPAVSRHIEKADPSPLKEFGTDFPSRFHVMKQNTP